MSEYNGGCIITLIWGITIAISIGAGILAWNWIEPESFGGAILFVIAWGLLTKIGHFIASLITALIFGNHR